MSHPAPSDQFRAEIHGPIQQLIEAGDVTAAIDAIRRRQVEQPDDLWLQWLAASALLRGQNFHKADEMLRRLLNLPPFDAVLRSKALSLAGRVKKERYRRSRGSDRAEFARAAAELYQSAYELNPTSFPLINWATTRLLSQAPLDEVHRLAQLTLRKSESEAGDEPGYWAFATRGEACLLLGRTAEAVDQYRRAIELAAGQFGDQSSMRLQVELIHEMMPSASAVLELFREGSVLVLVGHMLDTLDRPSPRFPRSSELEQRVRQAIARVIDEVRPAVGYCCGACGADLLFAEEMVARGKELHLVLPFCRADFYRTSIDFGRDDMAEYRQRFDAVAEKSTIHYGTDEAYLGDAELFEFVNQFMQGLAQIRAAELRVTPQLVAVLDADSESKRGGTRQFVDSWTEGRRPLHLVDLRKLRAEIIPTQPQVDAASRREPADFASPPKVRQHHREIKSMLFADVQNYSLLDERMAPSFFSEFLGEVAGIIQKFPQYPTLCNTWGDGLFMVFNSVDDAAQFALSLLARIEAMDFAKVGLPPESTVRIGLHTGPVYPQWDRLLGRLNFFGTHVNRAARIEPKTPPGCIYTSEQFAAILASTGSGRFSTELVGSLTLGKAHDQFQCRLYQLYEENAEG